jgi:glutamine---fructose-6-phosphate transaminase (isomerizing)
MLAIPAWTFANRDGAVWTDTDKEESMPTNADEIMLAEILNQPWAWAATLEIVRSQAARLQELAQGVEEVVFTGCGSGLNAAVAIAPCYQHVTGQRARAVPAAEIVFYPDTVFAGWERYLVVSISRSGLTSEVVSAQRAAAGYDYPTVAITCYPGSPLAREAAAALVLEPANEASVTTTQSLTSMILCGQAMAGILGEDATYLEQLAQLATFGHVIRPHAHDLGRQVAQDQGITRFAFVASGPLRGLAREAQLKIKEMVLAPSDSYPLLDFRHGPKSNVSEQMLITLLSGDRTRQVEVEFLQEMKGLGGRLLVICDEAGDELSSLADYLFEVRCGLPDFARAILHILPLHFLAYFKSLAVGLSPAEPASLSYWVKTARI